jgi:hypothetical protein
MHQVAFADLGCPVEADILGGRAVARVRSLMTKLTPTEFMLVRFADVRAERDRARDVAASLEQALAEAYEVIDNVRAETDNLMRESDEPGEVKSARDAATLIAHHLPKCDPPEARA